MMDLWDTTPEWKYMISVYWAFQTVTTVGFGDISIGHRDEYVLAIFWMLIGVSIYTLVIGNVSNIIAEIDSKAFELNQKMQTLTDITLKVDLPAETAERIQNYLQHEHGVSYYMEQSEELVKSLPSSLKREVNEFMVKRIVERLPFFRKRRIEFQHKILPRLKARNLFCGDILFSEGDYADEVIFILAGDFVLLKDISGMI